MVVVKEVPAPKGEHATAVIQQQPYSHWWQAPNAPEWALFFLTVPYVLVSIGLFVMTKRAANAASDSAKAALDNAKTLIASERPWINIERLELGELEPTDPIKLVGLMFTIKNTGRGPAFIHRLRTRLVVVTGMPQAPDLPSMPDYSKCRVDQWNGSLISGQGQHPHFARLEGGVLDDATHRRITKLQESSLVFYGAIEYCDGRGESHDTGFCCVFFPDRTLTEKGFWNEAGGPESYRYYK